METVEQLRIPGCRDERRGRQIMETSQLYLKDLKALLVAMPPEQIDMSAIEANKRRHHHRFYGQPETVYQWLLDQQRLAQAA
jgi:hypothetical protein